MREAEIIAAYRNGTSMKKLCADYGLGYVALRRLLAGKCEIRIPGSVGHVRRGTSRRCDPTAEPSIRITPRILARFKRYAHGTPEQRESLRRTVVTAEEAKAIDDLASFLRSLPPVKTWFYVRPLTSALLEIRANVAQAFVNTLYFPQGGEERFVFLLGFRGWHARALEAALGVVHAPLPHLFPRDRNGVDGMDEERC